MDLIDRDALEPFYESGTDPKDTYADMTFIRAEHVENAPAVNQWISCIQRLPEPLQTVIVCTDINTVTVAWLNGDHWTFADTGNGHTEDWSFDAVKYWMNLPEPPESEVQDDAET